MKKILLLSKSFFVVLCLLFCSIGVYAESASDLDGKIPKTINVQGRYTTAYGDPVANKDIKVYVQIKEKDGSWKNVSGTGYFDTQTDSEGLYNLSFSIVDFSSNTEKFRVGIDSIPTDDGYVFSSSPYTFYSSTAAYALKLDANGDKLTDGNFFGYTGEKAHIYTIKVDSATYASYASTAKNAMLVSTQTASNKKGYVWGITDNSGTQEWTNNIAINVSTATYAEKLKEDFVLSNNNFSTNIYTNIMISSGNIKDKHNYNYGYEIKVDSSVWADGAGMANSLSGSFKLVNDNFDDSAEYSNLKLKDSNFATDVVYTATTSWATNAVTANSLSGSFKLVNDNFDDSAEYFNLKLKDSNFATDVVYTATTSWATNAVTANSLNGSFKLVNDNFDDSAEYSNLKLKDSNFATDAVYTATTSWSTNAVAADTAAKLGAGDDISSPTRVWVTDGINQGWFDLADNFGTNGKVVGSGADLAEIYKSTEKLVPGDVVSIDTKRDNSIVKTRVAEDTLVAGVISTEPGVLLNKNEQGYKLALVGKVPTKVCNEGGPIKRGDLLVSASIPGYAKKAGDNPKAGTVIGKALGSLDSQKGTILVLVNLQ